MIFNYKERLEAYSSPCIEICHFAQEGIVCISYGERGSAGGDLRADDDDIWEF